MQRDLFWSILEVLPARRNSKWETLRPKTQRIPTEEEIKKFRRRKREITGTIGEPDSDEDSDSTENHKRAEQYNANIVRAPKPVLVVDSSSALPDDGDAADSPHGRPRIGTDPQTLKRLKTREEIGERKRSQTVHNGLISSGAPISHRGSRQHDNANSRDIDEMEDDDSGSLPYPIQAGFETSESAVLTHGGSPYTPRAMTHFAPQTLGRDQVVRRSWLSPEQTKGLLLRHYAQYPAASFQIPYLVAIVKENGGNGESVRELPVDQSTGPGKQQQQREEDISPIHMAAGTGNYKMLYASLPVFDVNCTDREGRTPLIYAVIGNDPRVIEILFKHNANLDCTDFDGRSAVHWAAYYGRYHILRLLIKYGANWRIHDREGRTALHWATGNENTNCLKVLLDKATSFEVNEPDMEQMTPLHWAVFHNHPKHLKKILQHDANILLTDVEGKTPIHWCAPHKDVQCAKMLLKYDPRIAAISDIDGRTPLHLACAENNSALVTLLASTPFCDINSYDLTMRTALHWACVSGHHYLVHLLLEKGASDSVKDGVGATPLHYACSKNHSQCVAALFSRENVSYLVDSEGRHALVWAVTKGHVQAVRILLEQKVNCNYKDSQGSTALHSAAHAGQTHCLALLLENGAEVDALDMHNHTPLFHTVEKGYAETANMLIQAHANVNQADNEGRTPLHWAALFGHLPVVSLLLANEAEVDAVDNFGKGAIHCGAYNGHNEVIKYLIECGANMNQRDSEQLTPLHWCAVMGHPHTVELLLTEGAEKNPSDPQWIIPTPLDYAIAEKNQGCVSVLKQFNAKTLAGVKNDAACLIQKMWRGHAARQSITDEMKQQIATTRERRRSAAVVIQHAFRSYRQRQPASISEESEAVPESQDAEDVPSSAEDTQNPKSLTEKPSDATKMSGISTMTVEQQIAAREHYKAQMAIIETHQRELEELKKMTELKMKQLGEALNNLNILPPPTEPLPPSISEVSLPYGIAPEAQVGGKPEFHSRQGTDGLDETSSNQIGIDRPDINSIFGLTMTTAEHEYFKIEKKLRQDEREVQSKRRK